MGTRKATRKRKCERKRPDFSCPKHRRKADEMWFQETHLATEETSGSVDGFSFGRSVGSRSSAGSALKKLTAPAVGRLRSSNF